MAEPTSMEKPTMAGNRNSINPTDLFEKVFPSKKDIECFVCGTKHFRTECTFITICGNVTIGIDGGVVGNNFDIKGNLEDMSFVCKDDRCLSKFMTRLLEEE